jgi:hypothetical protein
MDLVFVAKVAKVPAVCIEAEGFAQFGVHPGF